MTFNSKYVVVEYDTEEVAILLPFYVSHDSIFPREKVVSAGFYKVSYTEEGINVEAFGKSTSLNKTSREEDSFLIKQTIMGFQ